MSKGWMMGLVIIWTGVGLGLCCYLVLFPKFMKAKIAEITGLLERIVSCIEKIEKKG